MKGEIPSKSKCQPRYLELRILSSSINASLTQIEINLRTQDKSSQLSFLPTFELLFEFKRLAYRSIGAEVKNKKLAH